MSREKIYAEVDRERARQDTEWGGPEHDDSHDASAWGEFVTKHIARAMSEPVDNVGPIFRQQMIRVAALAVAAVEWFDRWEARQGR